MAQGLNPSVFQPALSGGSGRGEVGGWTVKDWGKRLDNEKETRIHTTSVPPSWS